MYMSYYHTYTWGYLLVSVRVTKIHYVRVSTTYEILYFMKSFFFHEVKALHEVERSGVICPTHIREYICWETVSYVLDIYVRSHLYVG